MTALHQAGQWEAVVAAAQELARLDPDNPDPGGIVSDAQAKIREAELADRYAQALNHLDRGRLAASSRPVRARSSRSSRATATPPRCSRQPNDSAIWPRWSDQAAAAGGHDDWDTALTALEKICAVDPTYRDAGARLEQARSAQATAHTRRWGDCPAPGRTVERRLGRRRRTGPT